MLVEYTRGDRSWFCFTDDCGERGGIGGWDFLMERRASTASSSSSPDCFASLKRGGRLVDLFPGAR